jgi:hypothetical protein
MRACFAGGYHTIKITAQQLNALRQYLGPRDKKLRASDVKEMFRQMS